MYENYPNQEGPDDVLVNLTDMNQSQILAECVKFGAEQGWDDDYLSGVLESNQLFERCSNSHFARSRIANRD